LESLAKTSKHQKKSHKNQRLNGFPSPVVVNKHQRIEVFSTPWAKPQGNSGEPACFCPINDHVSCVLHPLIIKVLQQYDAFLVHLLLQNAIKLSTPTIFVTSNFFHEYSGWESNPD
jgi:hypothetical protein